MLLDFFGGTGGVTKVLRRLGFKSLIWDTQHGPQFNLGAPGVEKALKKCFQLRSRQACLLRDALHQFQPCTQLHRRYS